MRNIWLLLKNYLLCALGATRGKKSQRKALVGILLLVLVYGGIFAYVQWLMLVMVKDLVAINLQSSVLGFGYVIGLIIAITFALQKVTGGQKANDIELLLAMPFKRSEIIVAKALSRYLFSLATVVLLVVPSVIAYMIYTPFSLLCLLANILLIIVLPFFAVGLAYLVDFVTAVCLPNFKYGNVVKAIFTLLVLVIITIIYERYVINMETNKFNSLIQMIVAFNPGIMLGIIGVSLGIFASGVWSFSTIMQRETKVSTVKKVDWAHKTVNRTPKTLLLLIKNEVQRYLNSTVLMVNTLIGPIGIVALTIWLLLDKGQTFLTLCTTLGLPSDFSYLFMALIYAFMAIMTYPAAFSISLEGKQFWILKSMPVKERTILLAKALFNVILITPILVISVALLTIPLNLKPLMILTILGVPVLLNFIVAFGGVLINLCFPKFDYESEAAVVKQSMSSFLMMLGGLVFIVLLIIAFFALFNILSLTIAVILPLIVLLLLAVTMVVLTLTVGVRIFRKL